MECVDVIYRVGFNERTVLLETWTDQLLDAPTLGALFWEKQT
jgi:hypothetical protein